MQAVEFIDLIETLGTVSIAMKKDGSKPKSKANTMMVEIPSNAVVGEWAAHKLYDKTGKSSGRAFRITHVPSGMAVPGLTYAKVANAKKALTALGATGVKWDGTGKPPQAFIDAIKKVATELKNESENRA
jgi:hypothetical protein